MLQQEQKPENQPAQQPSARQNHPKPYTSPQSHKPPIQTKEGKKPPIQAKQRPVQRKASDNDLKEQMGAQHGVNLSKHKEHPNSSFPGKMGALATIQGKDIHYAPGHYTEKVRKHEFGHAIDNALNGTPEGDQVIDGQMVDTSREKAADKIADAPVQQVAQNSKQGLETPENISQPIVQRYAFVNNQQITSIKDDFTPTMKGFVTDEKIRNYENEAEFKDHSEKKTDYIGNLNNGTWVRFEPSKTNILGERHDQIKLEEVMPAVNSKNFIYEPFVTDDLSNFPKMKARYDQKHKEKAQETGIKQDTFQNHGLESMIPKLAFGVASLLNMMKYEENTGTKIPTLRKGHAGKAFQSGLIDFWAFAQDCVLQYSNETLPEIEPLDEELQNSELGSFIQDLLSPQSEYLGVNLDGLGHDKEGVIEDIIRFLEPLTDLMQALSKQDELVSQNSEMAAKSTQGLQGQAQANFFNDWRNLYFAQNTQKAITQKTRYVGMGHAHLEHLMKNQLISGNYETYNMQTGGDALNNFITETAKLASNAKKIQEGNNDDCVIS